MKTFKEQRWMLIIYAIVLIAVGIVEFVLSIVSPKTAIEVVSYSIAAGLFVIGLTHLLSSFVAYTKAYFKASLLIGCFAIATGVVLIIEPWLIATFLIPFISVLAIAFGAIMLVKGAIACVYRYKVSWIISYFAVASVCITLGILGLVYRDVAKQVIYATAGVLVVALGVFILVYAIRLMNKVRKLEQAAE